MHRRVLITDFQLCKTFPRRQTDGLDSDFSIEFWNETAPKLKELRLQWIFENRKTKIRFEWILIEKNQDSWISMDKVLRIVLGDEKRRFKFWRTYSLEMNNKLTK
ncbi:hypothetical protein RCL_jg4202.t1 [Rhizophagus clarus]|uniref:Uncharacterized protein n=1 Tax=Rhizophagus clarus TaxID=94130 RepID=A0A8H3KTE1_9GLOM|nr:hypothetical protein RCL_jg4202.t1 [Rhizophagus clarus]